MEKLTEVLAMGGYATFVWPAYAVAGAVMLGVAVISFRSLSKAKRLLAMLQLPPEADET